MNLEELKIRFKREDVVRMLLHKTNRVNLTLKEIEYIDNYLDDLVSDIDDLVNAIREKDNTEALPNVMTQSI